MTDHSGLLIHQFAAREDSEVWNSTNVESSRQLLLLVGVDFENDGMAGHVGSCPRNLGGSSSAGSAPLSPEIHKNRNIRTLNDLIKQLCVRLKRLIHRGQRSLARAAATCFRKVLRANTILLATLFTASNDRHYPLRRNQNPAIPVFR
jgi:hypothetical protein